MYAKLLCSAEGKFMQAIPGWNCKTRLRRKRGAKAQHKEAHNSLVRSCSSCCHCWAAPAVSKKTRHEQNAVEAKIDRQKQRKREEQKQDQHRRFNEALKVVCKSLNALLASFTHVVSATNLAH
jgi:hypothetical protein